MKNRQMRIAALILLLLLASACGDGGAPQSNGAGNPVTTESDNTAGTARTGASPAATQGQTAGGTTPDYNESADHPYVVLITENGCGYCDQLKQEVNKLRSGHEARLLYYEIDKNQTGAANVAKALNVGHFTERSANPPWVGVLSPGGEDRYGGDVREKIENDEQFQKRVSMLRAAVTEALEKHPAEAPSGTATPPAAANRPAFDLDKLSEEDKKRLYAWIDARVDGKLKGQSEEINNAVKAQLANTPPSLSWGDTALFGLLGLSAIGLAGYGLLETHRAEKELDKRVKRGELDELTQKVGKIELLIPTVVTHDNLKTSLDHLDAAEKRRSEALQASLKDSYDTRIDKIERDVSSLQDTVNALLANATNPAGVSTVGGATDGAGVPHTTEGGAAREFGQELDTFRTEFEIEKERLSEEVELLSKSVQGLQEQVTQMGKRQDELGEASRKDGEAKFTELSDDLKRNHQQLTALEGKLREASQSVAQTVLWIGRRQVEQALAESPADGDGRASEIAGLEAHRARLRESVEQVAPLVESVSVLVEAASQSPTLPPEFVVKLRDLGAEVAQFERWERELAARIRELQSESPHDSFQHFDQAQSALMLRYELDELPLTQLVTESQALLDGYARGAARDGGDSARPALDEETVRRRLDSFEERLMDWFSSFFQLHSRMQAARDEGTTVEDAILDGMSNVMAEAREVLRHFDIQPAEVRVGQATYDRRLHERVISRESPLPPHTIIEVQSCGFRRIRDGEILRLAKVVTAGSNLNQESM